MAVTGDVWLSLSLAQIFPEIDPNNPGSCASLIRDKVNEVEGRFQQTLDSANGVIAAASSLIGQLDVVGSALTGAQAGIEELANNAGNTGVYFRLLGVCPDFPNSLYRNTQEFAQGVASVMLQPNRSAELKVLEQEIARAQIEQREALENAETLENQEEKDAEIARAKQQEQLAQRLKQEFEQKQETIDPCIPDFKGDTAYVGGMVGLIGAPNPLVLWDKLKAFAEVVPLLKDFIDDGADRFLGIVDSAAEFIETFSGENLSNLADEFNNFREELDELGKSSFLNFEDIVSGDSCNEWFCGRLKDLMPFLDPDRPGSPMNLALDFSDEITSNFVATLQKVSGLQNTARRLMGVVGSLQTSLNAFKNKVFEVADNLAATGIFIHTIGRDGSLSNNQEFVQAVNSALFDQTDPGRPTFRGDSAVAAGFLLVIGAPNVEALKGRFAAVGQAINGFEGKWNSVVDAAGRVEEAFNALDDSVNTSEVDPAFKVHQTNPQIGGTESTLVEGAEALFGGGSFTDAVEETAAENQQVVVKGRTRAVVQDGKVVSIEKIVPSAKLVQETDPASGVDKIKVEPTFVLSKTPVEGDGHPTEAPQLAEEIEAEAPPPEDTGSATSAIASLLRSANKTSGGLG